MLLDECINLKKKKKKKKSTIQFAQKIESVFEYMWNVCEEANIYLIGKNLDTVP